MLTKTERRKIRAAAKEMANNGNPYLGKVLSPFSLRDKVYRFYTAGPNVSSDWFGDMDVDTRVLALLMFVEANK